MSDETAETPREDKGSRVPGQEAGEEVSKGSTKVGQTTEISGRFTVVEGTIQTSSLDG